MTRRTPTPPTVPFASRTHRRLGGAMALLGLWMSTACHPTPPKGPESHIPEGELPETPADPDAWVDDLDERVGEVEKMIQDGQLQEALDLVELGLQEEPENADLHYARGSVLSYMDRDEDALAAHEKAIELNDRHVRAYVALGNLIAYTTGDHANAAAQFKKAVELAPTFAPARHGLGVAYYDLGQVKSAVTELEAAAKEDEKNVDTRFILAQAYSRDGRLEDGIATALAAIELEPGATGVDLRILAGRLLVAAGKNEEAVAQFEKAGSLAPDAPDLRLQVARGLLQAGATDAALTHIEALGEQLPNEPAVLVNWGRALAAKGELKGKGGAIAKFDAALKIKKELPAAHVYKVGALATGGECKDAKKALGKFEKLDPKEGDLARAREAYGPCEK